ncbi:F-box/LRR-repeat protein 20 [Frankliniella fusca]|uniref:F-box/LRR-repeat protein 20 n=1 Tax=Frankliniella fusca TaxID=407009 RepID=A0AAE1GSP4_9NEOP|nr:F-box/LRR-repeat protein 20 [Frankliniella fusca]
MPPLRQPIPMAQLAEQQLIDMVTEAGEGLVATPGDPRHTAVMYKLHVAMRHLPEAAASRLGQATLAAVDKALVYDVLERATSEVFMAFASWGTGWFPVSVRIWSDRRPRGFDAEVSTLICRVPPQSMPSEDPDVPQRRGPGDILADIAGLAGMPTPVDEDVARALLLVATACLPEHTTKIDTVDMSAATTTAVVAQLPKSREEKGDLSGSKDKVMTSNVKVTAQGQGHSPPQLQSLETLRLTGGRGCALSNVVLYPLARSLHHMHRLTVVSLGQSASDNVLRVLAQACPDTLEDLDVSHSRAVTDKGVAALAACGNLKVLKVGVRMFTHSDLRAVRGRGA